MVMITSTTLPGSTAINTHPEYSISRKIYVSKSDTALNARDIAEMEGLRAYEITGEWLAAHPEYGSSAALALNENLAVQLWKEVASTDEDASRHWLHLDAGYVYEYIGRPLAGSRSDPRTEPVFVSTYGDGKAYSLSKMLVLNENRTQHIQFNTGIEDVSVDVPTSDPDPRDGLRKIFVSKGENAWSLREIAKAEGMRASQITAEWLAANTKYGSSPDFALDQKVALRLWSVVAPDDVAALNNWLFFERGYSYETFGRLIAAQSHREERPDPLYVSTWGDGEASSLSDLIGVGDNRTEHISFEHSDIVTGDDVGGGTAPVVEPETPADEPETPTTEPETPDVVADDDTGGKTQDTPGTPLPATAPSDDKPADPAPVVADGDTGGSGGTDPVSDPVVPEPSGDVDVVTPRDPDAPVDIPSADPLDIGSGTAKVMGGRVSTLVSDELGDAVSVKIVARPDHGNVTVNPDNSLSLVMTTSDYSGPISFSYETVGADGSVKTHSVSVDVTPGISIGGWGTSEDHYMLQTDADNKVIVEHGDNHRKVHISQSDDALSIRDIAALEGLSVNDINGAWLAANPEYGASPEMALKEDAGMMLWQTITGNFAEPSSNWLLFEKGYTYHDTGRLIAGGSEGESELHPILITSYGEGDRPIITSRVNILKDLSSNIVLQDLALEEHGFQALLGENLLLDQLSFTHADLNIQKVDGFTLRESSIIDAYHDEPVDGGDIWNASLNRTGGMFGKKNDGVLIENTFWDHNGWADGYDFNMSADYPQPPSYYSHNVYLQFDNEDVTFRDNITMRGASYGAQIRSGGHIEDNLILDNNAGLVFHGGDYKKNGHVGNYSLILGNVVTSGQHLTVAEKTGATASGIHNAAVMTTLVDNIVAHVANPDDLVEWEEKFLSQAAIKHTKEDPFYDDTVAFNWVGWKHKDSKLEERNQNVDNLDWDVLYDTTIQNFTAQLLGKSSGTIEELADVLRAQADGKLDGVVDADLVNAYFRVGFGVDVDVRDFSQTLRFVPNSLADGVRWDNRLNWDTNDTPGTGANDSVDLAGNWVQYGGTTTIVDLTFGDGGQLNVTHGYLKVDGDLGIGGQTAELNIDESGQVWITDYADTGTLTVNVAGGRFAVTGEVTGRVDINVSDNAQVIIATGGASFDLVAGSSLHIAGDDAKVGFDGSDGDPAVLRLDEDATLGFTAEKGGFASIEEFRSGHFDQSSPDVQSGIDLGNSDIEIDISKLGASARTDILIDVDELVGTFGDANIIGLGANRDAELIVDYDADAVSLRLSAENAGSGKVSISTIGDETNAQDAAALWDALSL